MKKKIILFLCLFLFPSFTLAKEGIKEYIYDATVEPNGDVSVQELFVLEGEFNGFERILNYRNSNTQVFDGSIRSFEGSDIYNGDDITVQKIQSFDLDSITVDDLSKTGNIFSKVNSASKGEVGVYTLSTHTNGVSVKMFNPSNYGRRAFYLSYVIKNMAIRHLDVAELGFNIFSDELTEDVAKFEFYLHLPNNKTELRAWGHGPLNGYTKNIDQTTVYLRVDDLAAHTSIDLRAVFDLDVISSSTKESNVEALPSILKVETIRADEANKQRERQKLILAIVTTIRRLWLVGLFGFAFYCYKKYDKEYKSDFSGDYYRDFPKEYGPEVVGYLFRKYINEDDFSASILSLIQRKKLKLEEIAKKDYELTLLATDQITKQEESLLSFMFEKVEVGQTVTLTELKKQAKKNPESYYNDYQAWKSTATKAARKENFFEQHYGIKVLLFTYCIFGFALSIVELSLEGQILESVISIILSVLFSIYFLAFNRRTKVGNDDFQKWKALKKFMIDFGTMDDKELPEIYLWEKYLVYAVSLGCAKKLAKTMKIKMQAYQSNIVGFDPINFIIFSDFSHQVNNTVHSSISAAQTQMSSSSGYGGGFSSGGGSFGGGGGGGRF